MEIYYTTQGLLVYATIACYLLAFLCALLKWRKAGRLLYMLGFLTAVFSFAYRWYQVRHVPLQNLFEVFLFLGMLIYPVSVFCKRKLKVENDAFDMFIGIVVLFPAGFIFSPEPRQLPPALQCWLFAPHVAVYMLSYIFMAKAAFEGMLQLFCTGDRSLEKESASYRMVCAGFPLMTAGLLLGSWWGQLAWSDFWGWDPKELWSLASWLVYVGYFHFRAMFGRKHPRINSLWVISGLALIIITLFWVNLSRIFAGLHSYAT
ncbi:MAG: cytochrome c biogenesis protein CcsA [Sedimentisphaerales bacterium]|nr:cytochrome c biogenesis protein CcsA [Sedimentisphaerales bacterium]